jgi:hypothetical protein
MEGVIGAIGFSVKIQNAARRFAGVERPGNVGAARR